MLLRKQTPMWLDLRKSMPSRQLTPSASKNIAAGPRIGSEDDTPRKPSDPQRTLVKSEDSGSKSSDKLCLPPKEPALTSMRTMERTDTNRGLTEEDEIVEYATE